MVKVEQEEKAKAENIKLFNEFFPMKLPEAKQNEPYKTETKESDPKQTETNKTEAELEPKQTRTTPEPENDRDKGETAVENQNPAKGNESAEKPKKSPETLSPITSYLLSEDNAEVPITQIVPTLPEVKVPCNGVIKPDIVFFGESLPKVSHFICPNAILG